MSETLAWGRRYVMVRPDHFRVDYAINPYMDPDVQPDRHRAMAQWVDLVSTIERVGGTVEVVPQRADAPDMVYAMNLGLGVVRPEGGAHVVMSHMRYAERRMEAQSAQPWFERSGRSTAYVGRDGVGAHLEAGDVFAWGDALVAGYGPAHRGAGAQAPGPRSRRPRPRRPHHAPGDVPPGPRLLPARRPPRDGRAGRLRP